MLLNKVYDIPPSLNPRHVKCTGSDHDRYKSSQLQLIHGNMAMPIYTPLSYAMIITSSLYNRKFEMQHGNSINFSSHQNPSAGIIPCK
jgi:hypothetical protein